MDSDACGAFSGHWDAVKALKKAGADIMSEDDDGRTPRYYAARNGISFIINY